MTYFCDTCKVTCKSKRNYEIHLKSKRHIEFNNERKVYTCICGKIYTHRQSISLHRKTCSVYINRNLEVGSNNSSNGGTTICPPVDTIETLQERLHVKDQENNEMKEIISKQDEEMRELKDEMDDLRKKVEMLFASSGGNTTNNNNTHIENQNIETQNVFYVNNFGSENTDYITGKRVKNLIQNNTPFACIREMIETIHFDPDHPENHNIQVTNIKSKFAKIFKDNKWVMANKNRTIDDLIDTICVFLEEKYEENKEFLSEFRQERFQEFYDKYENQDKNTMKNIKDEVDITLINGTNEIYK